jgi:PncC family amidohydrolase
LAEADIEMNEPLEVAISRLLRERGQTLAIAESCTGGLLGHRVTNVPGSSDYFLGAIVAYSYEAKERLLGVRHETLYHHGAVSAETALEMARGARRALGADIGLAVTGIAGPGGGLPDKPVGLTWIALSTRDGEWTERHGWDGDRLQNKADSVEASLALLLRVLQQTN